MVDVLVEMTFGGLGRLDFVTARAAQRAVPIWCVDGGNPGGGFGGDGDDVVLERSARGQVFTGLARPKSRSAIAAGQSE